MIVTHWMSTQCQRVIVGSIFVIILCIWLNYFLNMNTYQQIIVMLYFLAKNTDLNLKEF